MTSPTTSSIDRDFEQELARTETRLRAFLRKLAASESDAEDALQECLARAWRSRASFDASRGTFSSWIMRIAFRSYLDQRDAQTRAPRLLGETDVTQVGEAKSAPLEAAEEVEHLLAGLKDVERDVLLRFHRDQFSIEDIAHELHLPRGTVKSHLHRARARLRLNEKQEDAR